MLDAIQQKEQLAITSKLKDSFSDVLEQVEKTTAEVPEKADRIVEIVKEELRSRKNSHQVLQRSSALLLRS